MYHFSNNFSHWYPYLSINGSRYENGAARLWPRIFNDRTHFASKLYSSTALLLLHRYIAYVVQFQRLASIQPTDFPPLLVLPIPPPLFSFFFFFFLHPLPFGLFSQSGSGTRASNFVRQDKLEISCATKYIYIGNGSTRIYMYIYYMCVCIDGATTVYPVVPARY